MVELGSEDSPLTLHGEQLVLTPRTSDPTTTAQGDAWLRTDLAPDDNQLGTLRFDSGTETLDVPIFAIGTSDDSVSEILRVDVNGEVGYVPVRDLDERPAFEELRIETGTGTAALHDLPELRDAFFEVASVSTNSPITAGDDLVVDYQVDNTGEEEDTQDIELQDFGNTVVDTDANVTISGLSSSSGTLTWSTTDDDEGDDWIRVRTNDDSATSFVEIESAIPDSGVARWNFEEDTDTTTAIDSWKDNDGAISGATYTTDSAVDDLAMYFDDDYVEVPNANSLNIESNSAMSISAYIKRHSSDFEDVSIVWKGGEYALILDENHAPSASNFNGRVTASTTLELDKWFHLVGVVDNSIPEALIYIDGSLNNTSSLSGSSSENTSSLNMGSNSSGSGNYISAILDDVRVYDKRLSDNEVSNLYNTGSIEG